MNKYIKINENDEIIDVFFEYQTKKIDGNEIFLEDTQDIRHKLNEKSISNEYGIYIFKWTNESIVEKTQIEIENDVNFIIWYRQYLKTKLNEVIGKNLLDINRSLEDIKNQWESFKITCIPLETKAELDTAYNNAISWLGL
jgi:hypothetical protein